jgi:hypothetical protein
MDQHHGSASVAVTVPHRREGFLAASPGAEHALSATVAAERGSEFEERDAT